MYYIIPIPITLLAVIVKLVSKRFKLKIFDTICNIIIFVGIVAFVYLYSYYLGYDMLEYVKVFFEF